jgi:hypothetical protein
LPEEKEKIGNYTSLAQTLGFSHLDVIVTSCVPWINYISGLFSFWSFKKSSKKLSSLCTKTDEFLRTNKEFGTTTTLGSNGKNHFKNKYLF